ncbi:hypothetical protein [Halobacterium rubrum]|jgi:hypothetical protein|uniref:hypothetical protein n=1 Tax=Halobacterium TaxID=2239 RepID=UPI001F2B10B1|nr:MULTISPECIES: hypothetical protein [Halobacterium]MDH5021746.1 hypothetical protein [Halobacterium rubrum]
MEAEMARSTPSPDDSEQTATYDTGTLPVSDDVEGRERKARAEHMVVVPQFDKWGDTFETYEVTTESGSTYEVGAREECGCPDRMFNSPADGCKHERRLTDRLNEGAITPPDHDVTGYITETVPQKVDAFADELAGLRTGLETAREEDANPADYEEAIGEVETFITTLADAYAEYRDKVDDSVPPLQEALRTDTDLTGILPAATEAGDE